MSLWLRISVLLSVSLVKVARQRGQSRGSHMCQVDDSTDADNWYSVNQDRQQEGFCLCFVAFAWGDSERFERLRCLQMWLHGNAFLCLVQILIKNILRRAVGAFLEGLGALSRLLLRKN